MAVRSNELFFEKSPVLQFSAEEWNKNWAEMAHLIAFDEKRPGDFNRIDYALLVINPLTNQPGGFCTVRELDSESVYWQYGGAFPGTRSTHWVIEAYQAFIDWTRERYKRITTLVSNQNIVYLKLAMKFGFRIIGVRTFKGEVYVELLNEFEGGK